jgi:hypothetical protein
VSSATRASSASRDQTKLLRRLADLVGDCRDMLLQAAVDGHINDEPAEESELQVLSILLHLLALRILEHKNLLHIICRPDEATGHAADEGLCTRFGALQSARARFTDHQLPFVDCSAELIVHSATCRGDAMLRRAQTNSVDSGDAWHRPYDVGALHKAWNMLHSGAFDPLWQDSTTLGYAYQYFSKPLRKETQATIQSANKEVSRRQLIAFTQLYTPGWIVEFLLQNTILPQLGGSIETRSAKRDWFLLSDEKGILPSTLQQRLTDLTLIDPACGSGHFLAHAFAFLFDLNRMAGVDAGRAAERALNQIHGADIDPSALAVCALTVLIQYIERAQCLPQAKWNGLVSVGDEALGSLRRNFGSRHMLMQQYSVVVTNPPYIGRKLISRELKSGLKQNYPESHHDLCAPFMVRGLELLKPGGYLGFITQSSVLSLPSFTQVRKLLSSSAKLECAVELGSGVFPLQGGDKVNSVLIVAAATPNASSPSLFIDLSNSADKEEELLRLVARAGSSDKIALVDKNVFSRDLKLFRQSPQQAFQYKCPQFLFELFARVPQLSSIADVRQGLATTDNSRFLKFWWEVDASEIGTIWFPYIKGAGTERWTSPQLHVVNFADNGREIKESVSRKYPYLKGKTAWVVKNEQFYFRAGLCFSFVSTEQFSVRLLPAGCIFDVAASAIFAEESERMFLLAYMNSRMMRSISKLINPTINMQVGDVKRLPILSFTENDRCELGRLAQECVEHKQRLDDLLFPGWRDNDRCFLLDLREDPQPHERCGRLIDEHRMRVERLRQTERQIDRLVLQQSLELRELADRDRGELIEWIDSESSESSGAQADILQESALAELSLLYAARDGCFAHGGAHRFKLWIEQTLKIDPAAVTNERLYLIAKRHFRGKPPRWAQQFAPQP